MHNLIIVKRKKNYFILIIGIFLQFYVFLFLPIRVSAQKAADWLLEKMPVELERDFAISSLPPHLRMDATVYLLDPTKGFYEAHKGTNGFICFVSRTEWEWGEFRQDLGAAISFDPEGARAIFPVYQYVASMRASGNYAALQIKDSVIDRINKGIFKAPVRVGISYMLSPIMRTYKGMPDNKDVETMSVPHYMFYAPYIINTDVGGGSQGPFVSNTGNALFGDRKGPYGYIILPAGKMEKVKIIEEDSLLINRLINYKPYFKSEQGNHHNSKN